MMLAQLDNIIALLERTPASFDALARNLPDFWTKRNEGGNTWTAFDVVGHLTHVEQANWIPRARWILEFGDSRPFPPLDRDGHANLTRNKTLGELLDAFAAARSQSLRELRAMNLQAKDLERFGKHPTLGAVTLSQLLTTWAAHDVNHLHQVSRIMAHQCREAVGPWRAFLGVMHCDGHSSPA